MEASTIPAATGLSPSAGTTAGLSGRIASGPLLRLRSDEQLVRLFRAGSDDAFRVIHDRYRTRLHAYARQMLGSSRADAEDALQDVFVRAYAALRANDRAVSLRAWLYKIAHNRCVDELRRPAVATLDAPVEVLELVHAPAADPMDAVERRESLRRLVEDVRRLPDQQRSALLMREISGMAYQDLAVALDVSVPAVKSLLVRARIGLAQAAEARDTACAAIRADLADTHERGVRASGLVRRHLHDCGDCSAYRRELRAVDARLAALVPALGPAALAAKLIGAVVGGGGGSGVAGGGAGGAGVAAAGAGAAGAGTAAATTGGIGIGATHLAAAVAVAVVSAGGAVEIHQSAVSPHRHPAAVHRLVAPAAVGATYAAGAPARASELLAQRRRHDVAQRLKLRIATGADPAATAAPPRAAGAVDPRAGGVAPPPDPADPTTPAPDAGAPAGGGTVVGAPSGSTAPPPPPPPSAGDGTALSTAPPEPAPAPATSADPASAPATPPTSATTGGATFPPHG